MTRTNNPTQRLNILTLAVACATLAAWGGSDTPVAPPPVVTAPTITTQSPTSVTVAEGATALLSVSAEGNGGALAYQWRSGAIPVAIAGAIESAYTTPAASLQDDGKVFGVPVSNSAGTTVGANSSLAVTERQWSSPALPRNNAPADDEPTANDSLAVAVDSLGHTHLLFGELRGNGAVALRYSRKLSGTASPQQTGWVTDADLPDNVSVQSVKLAAGPSGRMLATWREGVTGESFGGVIKAALFVPDGSGGAWSALGVVSADGALAATSPALAYIGGGSFEIVWRQVPNPYTIEGHDMVARRFVLDAAQTSGQWLAEEAIESLALDLLPPAIASDGAGNVIITFSTSDVAPVAYANVRSAASSAWSAAAATAISELAPAPATASSVVMNSLGRAVVLFRSDATRVFVRQYQFGGDTPGWQGAAAYAANYNPGLMPIVEPVAVFDAGNQFSIVSAHNNGRFLSLWPCTEGGCGEAQTFLNTSVDNSLRAGLRAARDAAGNLIVLFGLDQPSYGVMPGAMRFHAGLNAWRDINMLGQLGSIHVDGESVLRLAVHPDGSASALFPAWDGSQTLVRSTDFR